MGASLLALAKSIYYVDCSFIASFTECYGILADFQFIPLVPRA